MNKNDFIIDTADREKIRITAYGIENLRNKPCLIFVHGFKGFKDWGFVPYLGEYFSRSGYFFITFNFSWNGIGEKPFEFTEMEKFAMNSPLREVSELSLVIDAYLNGFFGVKGKNKIGIIGHSRGGAISLLTSSRKPEADALAVWSSISDFDRYSENQKKAWKEKGFFEVVNQRTGQKMRLNASLLEEIEDNKADLLNIEKAVSNLNRPLLIAHGEQDLTVPINDAEKLYSWSDKNLTEFIKIESTGHTFNSKHPFEGSNPKLEFLLDKTLAFFRKNFES
jgi:pimeloyl-ACP methyl ester carboxylesterase